MKDLLFSQLHDEQTFYQSFLKDLERCEDELIIESPYITSKRLKTFEPIFKKLLEQGVKIYIITRDPGEHENGMEIQSENAIRWCEIVGIQVFLIEGNHHRKLAMIDRKITWEGSLNILSQTNSREIMRRIDSRELTMQVLNFLKLEKFL